MKRFCGIGTMANGDIDAQQDEFASDRLRNPDTPSSHGWYTTSNSEGDKSPGSARQSTLTSPGSEDDESSFGTRRSTLTISYQPERIARRRKGLPRLDTTTRTQDVKPEAAELLSTSPEEKSGDPTASKRVLRATNPDPVSSTSSPEAIQHDEASKPLKQYEKVVSESCTSALP